MRTRKLGWTDLHLTEIGVGAWAMGGPGTKFSWGPQDDGESIAGIHRALELGVNWIDTAAIYGLGHSEEVVGKALAGRRSQVILATKCSQVWNDRREVSHSLKKESILAECDASLRRLNTDWIDLYQIHWPGPPEAPLEEGWEAMTTLIESGKVRYGGVSNYSSEQMARCNSKHQTLNIKFQIASLQPPYSMLRRSAESNEFPYCEANEIGIVAYSPMQAGLLTGKFDIKRLAPDDWRRNSKEFQEPNLHINQEFTGRLWPIALKYNKTPAQLALAWVLRLPVVTSAIVGVRRPSQIEETVGGSGWNIAEEDLQMIDGLLEWRLERIREADG